MSAADGPGAGVHATGVVFGESGVLVLGPSGAGKSALALALLALARAFGRFAALVGDDRIFLRAASGRIVMSGAPRTAGLIERRGAGVEAAASEPVAVARLVADLSGAGRVWPRLPDEPNTAVLEGVSLPRLALSSSVSAVDNALAVIDALDVLVAGRGNARNFT